ncbi:MAG: hypothetical protein OHK0012_20700 [Synechococcales cyanobacterium]
MFYTFAFFATPLPAQCREMQQIEGFQGSLEIVSGDGLTAAGETLEDVNILQRSDEVLLRSALRHDQVICQLFSMTPVLPLRFGTCFRSVDKLLDYLGQHHQVYRQCLEQLGERAEYLLKAFVETSAESLVSTPASGTDYLRTRRQQFLQQQHTQQQVSQEQDNLKQLWPLPWPRLTLPPQGDEQHREYFLLSPAEAEEALHLSQNWQAQYPHWQLQWSTALPPYHLLPLPMIPA